MTLPAGPKRVYLHVGTMKSGTTFLQQVLTHHRRLLADDGVLFPGGDVGASGTGWSYARQVAAVRDAIELPGPVSAADLSGAWLRMCAEIAAWDGSSAILSVEQLSIARRPQVRSIVAALAPAEVHVVVTARDLARVVPSSWQETVQNGLSWSWPEFAESVLTDRERMGAAARRFWRQHDLLDIVDRWSSAIEASRVHLVTVPPPGSPTGQTWRRLCQAVGLDATRYPLDGIEPVNTSLDRGAVELLRELNLRLAGRLDPAQYVRFVKRPLAKRALAGLPPGPSTTLSPAQLAWAAQHGEQVAAGLRERGVSVVGDLRELIGSGTAPTATVGALAGAVAGAPPGPDANGTAEDRGAGAIEPSRIAIAATTAAAALLSELARTPPAGRASAAKPARPSGRRQPGRPGADGAVAPSPRAGTGSGVGERAGERAGAGPAGAGGRDRA